MLYREQALRSRYEQLYGPTKVRVPVLAYLNTGTVILLTIGIICLLMFGGYNKKTIAKGYLSPDRGVVKVYPKTTGIVEEVLVREGQFVKRGEILAKLYEPQKDVDIFSEDGADVMEILLRSKSNIEGKIAAQKEHDIEELAGLSEKIKDLSKQMTGVQSQIEKQKKKIEITDSQIKDSSVLLSKGYVSKFEIANLKSQKLLDEQDLDSLLLTYKLVNSEFKQVQSQRANHPIESEMRLATLRQELSKNEIERYELKNKLRWQVLATITGNVTLIRVSPGQETKTDVAIMSIIPASSKFEAVLFVPTSEIAEISAGLETVINYRAFPYQEFGFHKGIVSEITSTPILPSEVSGELPLTEPAYRVTVDLPNQFITKQGKVINLRPGLLLDAEIVIRRQSMINLLIPPTSNR